MTRLPLRLLVIVLALGATGALGHRAFLIDLDIGASLDAARRSDQAVSSARLELSGLEATLRALVAPGQRPRAWEAEGGRRLDELRELLIALDDASHADHPLAGALDTVDRLAATERRVRDYAAGDQALLASDLVFNEARDIIATLDQQVGRAGSLARGRHAAVLSSLRQEQGLLVGGLVAVWLFASILLLPAGRRRDMPEGPADVELAASDHASTGTPDTSVRVRDTAHETHAASAEPVAAQPLAAVASLCTDLARVADGNEIAGLLERTSNVMDASGVIVWVAGPTGMELFPVAQHGYEARVFGRIGSIRRDAANLTAAAYREASLRSSAAFGTSAAALAAPLVGPNGPVGVLSAELRNGPDVAPAAAALATILAAQLATLVGSIPGATSDEAPPAHQANA